MQPAHRLFLLEFAVLLLSFVTTSEGHNFAEGVSREAWLRHPVLGDPSFDSFERLAKNPIHRGSPPYDWPVNGFLFKDPVSGDWFLYVGEYLRDYRRTPDVRTRCAILRSHDEGQTWENLCSVFENLEHYFEGETSPQFNAPDVSVVYAEGRYHMAYAWATKNTTWVNAANPGKDTNSGVGYAWAKRPEGPWHPIKRPIATTRALGALRGKYRRIYASTLIRRTDDWLVLSLVDSQQYYGWGLTTMTASKPQGPYSKPVLVLHPELPRFFPPLIEFFPAFTHEGYVYAPATSVALNRNYQALFRVPVEKVTDSNAWEMVQHGSVWHAEPVEHETFGIWGQTLTGFVEQDVFHTMFPSRDKDGRGTINLAKRPWRKPYRHRGFVLSGHGGPSLTMLKQNVTPAGIDFEGEIQGTVTLFWHGRMPLGPDWPRSNSKPHPLALRHYTGIRMTKNHWVLVEVDPAGDEQIVVEGTWSKMRTTTLAWDHDTLRITNADEQLWQGTLKPCGGAVGLIVSPGSYASVKRFNVEGEFEPGVRNWLYTEGLLGAAQKMADWEEVEGDQFRFGIGAISKGDAPTAKWNVEGSHFRLWAPQAPDYGTAQVWIDNDRRGEVSFKSNSTQPSRPLFSSDLPAKRCSVRVVAEESRMPLDTLEVVTENP